MAAMRNLAIGAVRLAGRTDITEATRWASRSMDRHLPSLASHNDLETAVERLLSSPVSAVGRHGGRSPASPAFGLAG